MISLSNLGVALKVVVPIICTVTENLMISYNYNYYSMQVSIFYVRAFQSYSHFPSLRFRSISQPVTSQTDNIGLLKGAFIVFITG